MGNGKVSKDVGLGANSVVTGGVDASKVPGKQTLTGQMDARTGDPYLDHDAVCAAGSAPGCFFEAKQRDRVIYGYQVA